MAGLELRRMGFCGVDESVSPELLGLISAHYEWVEWGVLFRSGEEGKPRYPRMNWIQQLCHVNLENDSKMNLAAHLCGERCTEIIEGNQYFARELAALGFRRFQLNITNANNVWVHPNRISEHVSNIQSCMFSLPNIEWIIQVNEETRCIWERLLASPPPNMSFLFDASCGMGQEISTFQSPYPDIPCGYAGGIGPSNIQNILLGVQSAALGKPVWIDMESSLRESVKTKNTEELDSFSIQRCFDCILIGVKDFNLPKK